MQACMLQAQLEAATALLDATPQKVDKGAPTDGSELRKLKELLAAEEMEVQVAERELFDIQHEV